MNSLNPGKSSLVTLLVGGVCLCCALRARAQVVNDGATATLNHVTNTVTGAVTVGTNGSFTLLVLTNAALLTNSGNGIIGMNATAKSNTVRLTSVNTRWLMALDLNVGNNGSVNHLVVSNGALVANNFAALGIAPTSSNNDAIITGAGSVWSNRNDFYVGYVGHGNSLVVSNGGLVTDNTGVVGIDALSSNNVATVTGANSLWSNRASLFVGFSGTSNRLAVTSGASVFASNNIVVGVNSGAISNLVLLSAGAFLTNHFNGVLGAGVGADANTAILSDSNTLWASGQLLYVGSNGALNRLVVSNGAQISSLGGSIGSGTNSSGNSAVITDRGSSWQMLADFELGYSGAGNLLVISNGAVLANSDGGIGAFISASNNEAIVSGTNSVWTNHQGLIIGIAGADNQLTVKNGGVLDNISGIIGNSISSSNNNALIADAGSVWNNYGDLSLGVIGSSNRLTAYKGGTIIASNIFVGATASSSNNNLTVYSGTVRATNINGTARFDIRRGTNMFESGTIEVDRLLLTNRAGSFLFHAGTLFTRGAVISNGAPFIVGAGGGSSGHWALLASTNKNTCANDVVIGSNAAPSELLITNGAAFSSSGNGVLGAAAEAATNFVLISGPGSSWVIGTDLHIGEAGASNRVVVSNGGLLGNEIGVIGIPAGSSNNEVLVTGPGSVWTNIIFVVGSSGPGNRFTLSNAALATASSFITIGASSTSLNNRLTVDGGTLLLTNNASTALLDVRRGTNVLNTGRIELDRLLVTNSLGAFEFNGGSLFTKNTTNNNARVFNAGNGSSAATMTLVNGAHSFANGLVVRSNATLTGGGFLIGPLTILNGATLAPATLNIFTLNLSPVLQGKIIMEVINDGRMLPNDKFQLFGAITYGGALVVTNIGAGPLSAGNEFSLFEATSYSGAFSSITLPPLDAGLTWSNRLMIDGSILVVAAPGAHFTNTSLSGTNLISGGSGGPTNATYWVLTSTNVALPATSWTRLLTNHFDALGNFLFTNGISPAVPQRFYRLQVP
jgi:T5SS/PEP-CTERM-associated repeat protein